MTNRERRDAGVAYLADDSVVEEMMVCRKILQKLNFMDRTDLEGIKAVVRELLGKSDGALINPPFYCDYGSHIEVGKDFFANYNCTLLDVARIKIGDYCQLAPNVSIYTAGHPVYPVSRDSGYEYGKEVTIGDHVWIGGNTVVCPGVIGAGSVVTKDIPDWCIAAGNPCKVIRPITDADKRKLYKDEELDETAWKEIMEWARLLKME